MKLGRQFKLIIELEDGKAIEITNPITCEFDIQRNAASTLNNGVFKLYNLSATNRNQIFQTKYNAARVSGLKKSIVFQAGYENLTTCFKGSLLEAYSYRQGSDIITYISAQDGGYSSYTAAISTTLTAGSSFKEGFKALASSMGLKMGAIGGSDGTHKRAKPLFGNSFYLMSKDFKGEFFIDLEKINKLGDNEYIKKEGGQVLQISSESGLLGTPIIQGTSLIVEMLFEPRVNIANLLDVKSSINPQFDGQYKVLGITHSGTISEASSGSATSVFQLYAGDSLSKELVGVQ